MTFIENLRARFGSSKPAATTEESAEALRERLAAQVAERNKGLRANTLGKEESAAGDLAALNKLASTDPLTTELIDWCRLARRVLFLGDQYFHPKLEAKSSIVLSADGFRVAWNSSMSREYGQNEHPVAKNDLSLRDLTPNDLVLANLSQKRAIAELYAYANKIGKP